MCSLSACWWYRMKLTWLSASPSTSWNRAAHPAARFAPRPSMMYIAPSRPTGFGRFAYVNM